MGRRTATYRRTTFVWPIGQVVFWTILILATASTIIGVFGQFMTIQNRMRLGVPWLFPFGVTTGSLTILFIVIMLIQLSQGNLQPALMMLLSFVLVVLYITGTVGTGIQLFGPGQVANSCRTYVDNAPQYGATINTLAWLQQNNICSCWYAVFAFWIIGTIFFIWMLVMAAQVNNGMFDTQHSTPLPR